MDIWEGIPKEPEADYDVDDRQPRSHLPPLTSHVSVDFHASNMADSSSRDPLLERHPVSQSDQDIRRMVRRGISRDGDESEGITSTEYLSTDSMESRDTPRQSRMMLPRLAPMAASEASTPGDEAPGGEETAVPVTLERDGNEEKEEEKKEEEKEEDVVEVIIQPSRGIGESTPAGDDDQATHTSGLAPRGDVIQYTRATRRSSGSCSGSFSGSGKQKQPQPSEAQQRRRPSYLEVGDGGEIIDRPRKKSQIEIDIDKIDEDDPQFGESVTHMLRIKQRRKTIAGGKKARNLSRRRSSRSSRASGRSTASSKSGPEEHRGSRQEDFLDIYRPDFEVTSKEELLENLKIQEDIIDTVRCQPWKMKRKLRMLRLAKAYVERYEGHLSKGRGYKETGAKFWRRLKRELVNFAYFFVPWEMRIKKIESHFGSVVSSYFTFLRWLFWVNIVLTVMTMGFIVIPEILVGSPFGSTPSKTIPAKEQSTALNFLTLFDFEGYLKYSVLFYGYYGNEEIIGKGYRLPLAYFLAGLCTLAVSYIIVLKKMATNSRNGNLASIDEHYVFSWKLFTSWDYMIGHGETAKNKSAEISTSFRETILEEQEKKRQENKYCLFFLRTIANILVLIVLASSSYAIYLVVERSKQFEKRQRDGESISWYERNEVTVVMSLITALFPSIFDWIGLMEKYHPRINLRWQLARILVLYLLNLYTLMIALYNKIQGEALMLLTPPNTTQCYNTTAANDVIAPFNNMSAVDNVTMIMVAPATVINNCTIPTEATRGEKEGMSCWETMIGQELMKLTVFDMGTTLMTIILIDFLRGLCVRCCNPCWCWDLERKFPEYGEFKIAENLLHLINNQAMIWLGTFFSPVLPALNLLKLLILVYVRSWAVLMCNIPLERVFRASRSNNFYFALLLLMLFLVTLPVMYLLVMLPPSKDCGPFSGFDKSYLVLTDTILKEFPSWVSEVLSYVTSAGVILPLFLLLVMAIYYLTALARSYKEANRDLRMQLHYERTEEKRKIYAMADARKEASKKATDNLLSVSSFGGSQAGSKPDIWRSAAMSMAIAGRLAGAQASPDRRAAGGLGGLGGAGTGGVGVGADLYQGGRPPSRHGEQLPGGRPVKVIRVPGMSAQQAETIRANNPNIKVMSVSAARQKGLLNSQETLTDSISQTQSIESERRSQGQGLDHGEGQTDHQTVTSLPERQSPMLRLPVAVVRGHSLEDARDRSPSPPLTIRVYPKYGTMEEEKEDEVVATV